MKNFIFVAICIAMLALMQFGTARETEYARQYRELAGLMAKRYGM